PSRRRNDFDPSCPRLSRASTSWIMRRKKTWMAGTSPAMAKGWCVMNYWLVKSEPSSWSWDQQVAKGAKGEAWTGVRNFTARQNLVKMKNGDHAFFYHSNEGK